jgi:ABC-type transport system substrate-binding protein
MFASKKWATLIALVMIVSLILTACGPTPEPETIVERVVETVEVEVTKIVEGETVVEAIVKTVEVEKEAQVEVTRTPSMSEANRMGGWLDMIVFIEEPSDQAAITQLDAGEMDVYAYDIANPDIYQAVHGMDDLAYTYAYGSYRELTMNPARIEGDLNPFSNQKIREALHWLVDRNHIVEESYGDVGWLFLTTDLRSTQRQRPTFRSTHSVWTGPFSVSNQRFAAPGSLASEARMRVQSGRELRKAGP